MIEIIYNNKIIIILIFLIVYSLINIFSEKNEQILQNKTLTNNNKNDSKNKIIINMDVNELEMQYKYVFNWNKYKNNMNGYYKCDVINYLIKKYNYKSYLEISTTTTGFIYDQITNINKDVFLYKPPDNNDIVIRNDIEGIKDLKDIKNKKYDIIFVDPYHTFIQSKKDIELAYSLLNNNGIIIIHDCYPKHIDLVNPEFTFGPWCGETYKALIDFNINNSMVQTFVIDCDFGCGLIIKNKKRNIPYVLPDNMLLDNIDFDYFINNTEKLIDILSVSDFLEINFY